MTYRTLLFLLACVSVAISSVPPRAHAQIETADGAAARYVLNVRDVEIHTFAEEVSMVTGRTLILDPSVKGTVTIVSDEALDRAGVWDLFQSVLRVNGYAAVDNSSADITVSRMEMYLDSASNACSRSSTGRRLRQPVRVSVQ